MTSPSWSCSGTYVRNFSAGPLAEVYPVTCRLLMERLKMTFCDDGRLCKNGVNFLLEYLANVYGFREIQRCYSKQKMVMLVVSGKVNQICDSFKIL
jgi:hypothetical protein